jgi:hypothetical protein
MPRNFKPKLGCACVSDLTPGFVAIDDIGHVNCALPNFNPYGSLMGEGLCNGDFIVLH